MDSAHGQRSSPQYYQSNNFRPVKDMTVIDHSHYSPDLAPRDLFVFPKSLDTKIEPGFNGGRETYVTGVASPERNVLSCRRNVVRRMLTQRCPVNVDIMRINIV